MVAAILRHVLVPVLHLPAPAVIGQGQQTSCGQSDVGSDTSGSKREAAKSEASDSSPSQPPLKLARAMGAASSGA
eukprot:7953130-Alexandrium_andersonii.AAC.1